MANKPRRKANFSKYIGGAVEQTLGLSTLGAKTLISMTNSDIVTELMRVSSVKLVWMLANLTPSAGDGPVLCGIAHSDYTDAEIEEWIENDAGWEVADQIGQEVAKRKIRRVGSFNIGTVATQAFVLNDGRPIKTKLGWLLSTGQTLKWWAYNAGTNALETTGPNLTVNGKANLWIV